MKCKECGKKFHYCSSCSCETWNDHGFCDVNCFFDYPENQSLRGEIRSFYKSLDSTQRYFFKYFLEEIDEQIIFHVLSEIPIS